MQLKIAFILLVAVTIDGTLGKKHGKHSGKGKKGGKGKPTKSPMLDICKPKKYLQKSETDCLCNCVDKCPKYSDLKDSSCSDEIKTTCKLSKGELKPPVFDAVVCVATNVKTCDSKDFSECETCVNNCVTAESATAARNKYECLSTCYSNGDCSMSKGKSQTCKQCKDGCDSTATGPPAPPST